MYIFLAFIFFFSPVIKVNAEPIPKSLSMKSSPVKGTTMGKNSWSKGLTLTSNKVTRVWRAVIVTPKFK
ncbi:hypothetical protein ACOSP7_017306 [Xanthoceras sorbifolium]